MPPAAISEDGTTALITVPLTQTDDFELTTERVETMREIAPEGMPAGIDVYVTGPEAFIKDVGSIFEGADFLLLAFTAGVVAVLLLVTYRSPVLWLIPLAVVGTADVWPAFSQDEAPTCSASIQMPPSPESFRCWCLVLQPITPCCSSPAIARSC